MTTTQIQCLEDLADWVPTDLSRAPGGVRIVWRFAGVLDLDDTVFSQLAKRLADAYPEKPAILSNLELLDEFRSASNVVPPSGFIFHVGRCGSTVVSNALRAIEGAITLSEPDPLIELLTPVDSRFWEHEPGYSEAARARHVAGMVAALGKRRRPNERRLFIKFADWNLLGMGLVRSIWPEVPTLIVYRDPIEVVASYMKGAPDWLLFRQIPAAYFGLDQRAVRTMPYEEYCVRIEGALFRAAAAATDDRVALLNYSALNARTMLDVAAFLGIDTNEIDIGKLTNALALYAKDPKLGRAFSPDSADKQRSLPIDVRRLTQRHIGKHYEALERLSQSMSVSARLIHRAS